MKKGFSHQIQTCQPFTIWKFSGDLIIEETAALRQCFYNWLKEPEAENLIVEFNDITKIDASGVSLLVSFQNVMNRNNRKMKIRGVPHHIFPLFEKTNLVLYFDIEKI